jgi:hypothetical protein
VLELVQVLDLGFDLAHRVPQVRDHLPVDLAGMS